MLKKKYIYIVVSLSIVFMPKFVLAKTTTDYFEATFIKNYSYVDTKGKHANFEHFIRESDGETAYCIEPGVSLSKGKYKGYYDLPLADLADEVGLSKKELNKVSLYAYFGYGYRGHNGEDWIVATQTLIWEETGRDLKFTSRYNPSDPYKYVIDTPEEIEEHMDEIKKLVDNFLSLPKWNTKHALIPLSTSYNFGKLNGFEVKKCENCTYSIQNKELVVTPIGRENGKVLLEKKADRYEESFIVYEANDGQNIMVRGNLEPQTSEVTFDVVSGSLKLIKYDKENKSCKAQGSGSLKGSVYNLYKEDGTFVSSLTIGEDCSAFLENLELGNYYIKEEKAGLNYELDPNTYSFSITLDSYTKELVVYDEIYLGQIEIEKHDSKTKVCKSSSPYASLSGAIYGIYTKEGKLVQELIIGEDCRALSKKDLLLGEYYLKEIKAPKGYKLDKKKYPFQITKENANEKILIKVADDLYKTRLTINKNYLYFNDIKPEEGAIFEIYYKNTLEKVATLTIKENGYADILLPYGEYIIKQVNGKVGYHFVEDSIFVVDEKTEYKTHLTFLNKPYRGTLNFYKTDLVTGEFLPNVSIEIYNELDELVYRGITDEDGKIVVENLPYGKYSILENKALNGYQLLEDRLYFEILKDQEKVEVFMENERVRVPDTEKNLNVFIVYAFVFWILGASLLFYAKEKK